MAKIVLILWNKYGKVSKLMKIIKIDETYATDVKQIIRAAYLPLLEKYHDEKENPANKTVEDIIYDLRRDHSDAYLLLKDYEKIGYVRVGQRSEGEYSIADLAIRPEYQGNGYAALVMERVISDCKAQGRKGIVLTCKDRLIKFYEQFGFVNEGESQSEHGGATWYEMRLLL